jgi:hypothetical protein
MDHHVRALGWAYIVYGAASAAVSLLILVWFGSIADAWAWAQASGGMGPVLVAFLGFHLLLAVPMIVGGVFLLRLEEWSRLMLIVVSAVNILNLPVGSALAAYGLWVLLTPETEPLFMDPVFKARTRTRPGTRHGTRETNASGTAVRKSLTPSIVKDAGTNLPE